MENQNKTVQENEIKFTTCKSQKYKVEVPGQSWAAFTISEDGDLFIDSDWGYWCYSWRAFRGDFIQDFLIDMSADYLINKLVSNQRQFGGKAKINDRAQEALILLFNEFKRQLKALKK